MKSHITPYTENELDNLKHKINLYFLEQFLTIISAPRIVDNAVKNTEVLRDSKQNTLTLTEFADAFDVKGNFIKPLPNNFCLLAEERILGKEGEIDQYGLNNIGLSDMEKLIISGVMMEAGVKLDESLVETESERYMEMTEELLVEQTKVKETKTNAQINVIQFLGYEQLKEMTARMQELMILTHKNLEKDQDKINELNNEQSKDCSLHISQASKFYFQLLYLDTQLQDLEDLCKKNSGNKELVFTAIKHFYDENHKEFTNIILHILDTALDKDTPLGKFFCEPSGGNQSKRLGMYGTADKNKSILNKIHQLRNDLLDEKEKQAETEQTKVQTLKY